MANPGPLASTFWLDEELESQMHLDGVITIVDSKNILRRVSEKAKKSGKACNEATLQIAYADILMMNVMDLVLKARTWRTLCVKFDKSIVLQAYIRL